MPAQTYRIGYGEDAHRLATQRPLVLGGVRIAHAERGAVAHSDGDAILHALADALLSGMALGDIGQYFPDTDIKYKDLDSRLILEKALQLTQDRGYSVVNAALVVTLDTPKLGGMRLDISRSVADMMSLLLEQVGISFKTSEGLAPDHVQVRATVLLAANE